jgi:superfamily II DNA/RNA helicase
MRMAILDEADKMLEMGFQEPIEQIFDAIYLARPKLQVCLFSATIEKWVIDMSKKIMRNKEHTYVNLTQNLKGRIPVGVSHLAVNCLKTEKITTIADLSNFLIKKSKKSNLLWRTFQINDRLRTYKKRMQRTLSLR